MDTFEVMQRIFIITLVIDRLLAIIGFRFPWETCECCGKKIRDHKAKDHNVPVKITDKEQITDKELVKKNSLRLIQQHVHNCNDLDCNSSISLIYKLLEMAGIELTEEEKNPF